MPPPPLMYGPAPHPPGEAGTKCPAPHSPGEVARVLRHTRAGTIETRGTPKRPKCLAPHPPEEVARGGRWQGGGRIIIHSLTRVGTGISLYRPGDGPLTSTDHWVSICSCSSAPSPGLKRHSYRVHPGPHNYPLAFLSPLLPTVPLIAFPVPLLSLPQGPDPEPTAGPSPGVPARLPLRSAH